MNPISLQERAKSMLNMTVVAVITRQMEGAQLHTELDSHFNFMVDLEQRGLLFLSGPLLRPDQQGGLGLTILNVDSIEVARTIWAKEPFYLAGLRNAEFYMWNLMEGNIRLSVALSSQSMQMQRGSHLE